jgi:hypothetical protein
VERASSSLLDDEAEAALVLFFSSLYLRKKNIYSYL